MEKMEVVSDEGKVSVGREKNGAQRRSEEM